LKAVAQADHLRLTGGEFGQDFADLFAEQLGVDNICRLLGIPIFDEIGQFRILIVPGRLLQSQERASDLQQPLNLVWR